MNKSSVSGRRFVMLGITALLLVACNTNPPQDDFRVRWSQLDVPDLQQVDVEAEVRFGREVAARFLGGYDGTKDASLQQYVNTVGQYLVQFSGRSDIEFHFWVVESEQMNAYAAPGGYIFVTDSAINLMQNEAELAGVLAHEIAHVTQRHIVNALDIKAISGSASLTQFASGANDAFRVAFEQATDQALLLLQEDGLQHQDEYEADEVGTLIMVQAGYDPKPYQKYLSRVALAAPEQLAVLSKTHPPLTSRVQQLRSVHKENAIQNLDYPVMEERFLIAVR